MQSKLKRRSVNTEVSSKTVNRTNTCLKVLIQVPHRRFVVLYKNCDRINKKKKKSTYSRCIIIPIPIIPQPKLITKTYKKGNNTYHIISLQRMPQSSICSTFQYFTGRKTLVIILIKSRKHLIILAQLPNSNYFTKKKKQV